MNDKPCTHLCIQFLHRNGRIYVFHTKNCCN